MKCVLTIGKFEGIHLGHQALLREVAHRAKAAELPAITAVFEPHPFRLLREANYAPIFTAQERNNLIRAHGIDRIETFCFDANFAEKSASEFCREIRERLHPHEIIVGENYRFGRNREGTANDLREIAAVHEFKIVGEISTSRVRELLNSGEFSAAARLLGFPFFVAGEVKKGQQIGRVLGFPTLNLYPPEEKFLPANGVYETKTTLRGKVFRSLTNIGTRPTVTSETQISVETHIPTLQASPDEMYGDHIKVEFMRFIRPERRFGSLEELQAQIAEDLGSLADK